MPDGIYIGLISLLTAVLLFMLGWLRYRRKDKVEVEAQRQAGLSERFDDASELARYIRDEVERQVAPIRDEMKKLKSESHEMHDAVRARETQLWLWDQRGRQGALPMLPKPILARLGLIHLTATEVATTPEEGT